MDKYKLEKLFQASLDKQARHGYGDNGYLLHSTFFSYHIMLMHDMK